jgi:DNA-binding transcriptional MerR regulator
MPKKMLSADVAKLLDVTPATVRLMERRGTLPAERTTSGVRLFDRADVERLAKDRLKRMGGSK